jgi:hypothetical protein
LIFFLYKCDQTYNGLITDKLYFETKEVVVRRAIPFQQSLLSNLLRLADNLGVLLVLGTWAAKVGSLRVQGALVMDGLKECISGSLDEKVRAPIATGHACASIGIGIYRCHQSSCHELVRLRELLFSNIKKFYSFFLTELCMCISLTHNCTSCHHTQNNTSRSNLGGRGIVG